LDEGLCTETLVSVPTARVANVDGHGDAGAVAGAAGREVEVVGIQALADRVGGIEAGAEPIGRGDLGEDDGAGGLHAGDDRGVARRNRGAERLEAGGRGQTGDVDQVFQDDGNTVERGARALGFALGVERARFVQGVWIQGDDGVYLGAGFVVGLDALEVEAEELFGGERTGVEGRVDVGDGGGGEFKRTRRGEGERSGGEDRGECEGAKRDHEEAWRETAGQTKEKGVRPTGRGARDG
jgi:hypothetical protein